jgi:hypothetical protein
MGMLAELRTIADLVSDVCDVREPSARDDGSCSISLRYGETEFSMVAVDGDHCWTLRLAVPIPPQLRNRPSHLVDEVVADCVKACRGHSFVVTQAPQELVSSLHDASLSTRGSFADVSRWSLLNAMQDLMANQSNVVRVLTERLREAEEG